MQNFIYNEIYKNHKILNIKNTFLKNSDKNKLM